MLVGAVQDADGREQLLAAVVVIATSVSIQGNLVLLGYEILLLFLLGNIRAQILLQILQGLELAVATALLHPV